ncbi:hypothetical protein X801_08045, partial [Opisthorchis viverrini]
HNTKSVNQFSRKRDVILGKLERLTRKDAKAIKDGVLDCTRSWEDYKKFVSRVDTWYSTNEKRYLRYMSLYAREELSETEFKIAFHDLNTSFSEIEIEILYQMLDPTARGRVEYTRLYEAIWMALATKFINDDGLLTVDVEKPDKWILLTFKVPSCEPFDMPTTFEQLVELGYTGTMLRTIIQTRVPCLSTRAIVIFTDVSRYAETTVHCNQTLYEFPYIGGPKCAPEE